MTVEDMTVVREQIVELLRKFKLPTVAAELVPRLIDAGYPEVLEVVHEVLEMERQDRWERRVG